MYRDNNDRQRQEQDEYQQWLEDPVAKKEYKHWLDSQEKGNQATHAMPVSKENQNGFNRK